MPKAKPRNTTPENPADKPDLLHGQLLRLAIHCVYPQADEKTVLRFRSVEHLIAALAKIQVRYKLLTGQFVLLDNRNAGAGTVH